MRQTVWRQYRSSGHRVLWVKWYYWYSFVGATSQKELGHPTFRLGPRIILTWQHAVLLLCPPQFCVLRGLFDLFFGTWGGSSSPLVSADDRSSAAPHSASVLKSSYSSCLWASFLFFKRVTPSCSAFLEHPLSLSCLINEIFAGTPSPAPHEL